MARSDQEVAAQPSTQDPRLQIVEAVIKSGKTFGGKNATTDRDAILAFQGLLMETPYGANITPNGKIDAATSKAILELQKASHKTQDGVAGRDTFPALRDLINKKNPPAPAVTAAKPDANEWTPLLDHHGNEHKGYGEPFLVRTDKGKNEPVLVNTRTGDLKVPEGFVATNPENQQTVLRATAAQAETLKMIPGRELFLRPGSRPAPNEAPPVPRMLPGWQADGREDNSAGQNVLNEKGVGMARRLSGGGDAVPVNYGELIQAAIKNNGVISANGGNAASDIGRTLQDAGVIKPGAKSEVEALALGTLALQAGPRVGINDNGFNNEAGGGGDKGGKGGGIGAPR